MQEHKYSIKQWSKDDRPREKLRSLGAENLSIAELLAIILHHGTRQRTALDLARDLMKQAKDSLPGLCRLSIKEMMKVNGIGEAKAVQVAAALELGRRRLSLSSLDKKLVSGSQDIATYLQSQFRDHRHEVFGVVYLNRANKINHFEIISEGGISGTVADPRIILRKAIEADAVSLILCHNHPSGSLRPSRADEQLTEKIREAASYLDMKVLDHIIVSEEGYYSFADEGLL
jgi:DNA repair protein RadC